MDSMLNSNYVKFMFIFIIEKTYNGLWGAAQMFVINRVVDLIDIIPQYIGYANTTIV